MQVKPETMLTLLDLMNDSVEPEIALENVEKLSDEQVADLLELYIRAEEEVHQRPSRLLKSAVRRLRGESCDRAAPSEGESPNS